VDGKMKRFHKGAFYLAQKLNVDILPVVIDGSGYTLTKHDFFLKDGTITLNFLERIKPEDTTFGTNYTKKAKNVSRYFKKTFEQLKLQHYKPAYFRQQLIYNYIYKGPVLEWYLRVKLKLEKNYELIHSLIPKQGKILDVGCGYGFMDYALYFASPHRKITGIDYDEEKIQVANNCFSKDENINFIATDALNFCFDNDYDAVIMADMLHYLDANAQKKLIEKSCNSLNPDGILFIRDANADLKQRHSYTRMTEFFSTKLIGFNKTSGKGLNFFSEKLIKDIATENNMSCVDIDTSKYTSNIIYILKKNDAVLMDSGHKITANASDE